MAFCVNDNLNTSSSAVTLRYKSTGRTFTRHFYTSLIMPVSKIGVTFILFRNFSLSTFCFSSNPCYSCQTSLAVVCLWNQQGIRAISKCHWPIFRTFLKSVLCCLCCVQHPGAGKFSTGHHEWKHSFLKYEIIVKCNHEYDMIIRARQLEVTIRVTLVVTPIDSL